MRRILIYCQLFITLTFAQAQVTNRYPIQPTSSWRVNYAYEGSESPHFTGDDIFTYYIESDTFLNSVKYYKIYKTGIAYYDQPFSYEKVYVGAIRDENNKFFFMDKNETSEVTLYDFNLKPGDTIHSLIENSRIINSIDTLPGGRRIFRFQKTHAQGKCLNYEKGYFIEGIGSMGGLFEESPCNHIGFREYFLVCYSIDGQIIYQDNDIANANCTLNETNLTVDDHRPDIKIIQIPAQEKIVVESADLSDVNSVELFNVIGIKIKGKKISDLEKGMRKFEIDYKNLNRGIYILKISTRHSFMSKAILL